MFSLRYAAEGQFEMVRPGRRVAFTRFFCEAGKTGVAIYGLTPSDWFNDEGLQPIATWKARSQISPGVLTLNSAGLCVSDQEIERGRHSEFLFPFCLC